MRNRLLQRLMLDGVTIVDPATTYVDAQVSVGEDTVLEPMTILQGRTRIGRDCRIGPYAEVYDSTIGDGCRIERSWLRECRVQDGSDCGPFSKLRPGTDIGVRVHVGSFAEIVRSRIGGGSSVPHVAYLGDTIVGENVNIGAGTITANFDGERKNSQYSYGFPNGDGDCNCTTWLERLGLPLLTGRMDEFIRLPGIVSHPSRRFGECV